jgi:DNA-binding MarR family transcriptional regulator
MLTAQSHLIDRLDHELQAENGMSLPEYSALLRLAEAPERRLRMSQLAQGIFLTRSGVTRLIDRLERDGLVQRRPCDADGRGSDAVLTQHGLDTLRTASRTHLRGIKMYFLDQVDEADLAALDRIMRAVDDRIERPEDARD